MRRLWLVRLRPADIDVDLSRLRGYVFIVLASTALAASLAAGGDIGPSSIVPALLVAVGIVLLLRPRSIDGAQGFMPFLTTGVILGSMLTVPPAVAPFGLGYLVLVSVFGQVVLPTHRANLLTGCAIGALILWSTLTARPLLADVLAGSSVLVVGAAAARHVGSARREALAQAVHARRDAEELSLRDPLTNLPNRRAFDAEADLRAIEGRLGGVILVDVDHFKTVNDEFGHPAGDEVLVEVAKRLAGALRRADLPARLGGDEFAVLLEGPLTIEGLRRVADAVRGATSAFAAETQAGYVKITTSVGGALVPLDVPEGRRVRAVRALADRALYEAKKAGRDRAVIDGEQHAPSARRGRRRPRQGGPRAA